MAIIKKNGPDWLQAFLAADYFSHCSHHASGKPERNHFCIDCREGPLCSSALHHHSTHATLQIRRASHRDSVRISDIHHHLDISDIQSFIINGAKIIFLRTRPHARAAKPGLGVCEVCGRSIADPVRFCSISCKLAACKHDPDQASLLCEEFQAPQMEPWQMDHLHLPYSKLQKFISKVRSSTLPHQILLLRKACLHRWSHGKWIIFTHHGRNPSSRNSYQRWRTSTLPHQILPIRKACLQQICLQIIPRISISPTRKPLISHHQRRRASNS